MTDRKIKEFSQTFKNAITEAKENDRFADDILFWRFPKACCGDTCYLLGEFLKRRGIDTIYVCGDFNGQTHAWLVVKDERVEEPIKYEYTVPDNVLGYFRSYAGGEIEQTIRSERYEEKNLINGLIIDITADQFGESPVYVGPMDSFHSNFIFMYAHDYNGIGTERLEGLLNVILDYIC